MESKEEREPNRLTEADTPQCGADDHNAPKENWSLVQFLYARYIEMEAAYRSNQGHQADVQGEEH